MEIEVWLVIGMFACFIFLLMLGIPVAYVLAGTAVIFTAVGSASDRYFGTFTGLDFRTFGLIINRIFQIMENWVLVALPMFVFMGLMLEKSGAAERLMHAMQALFERVHGGLALSTLFIGVLLAASTGIIGASVVLLGVLALNPMLRQGYDPALALGTIASAGTLGILIPPSIMLVLMGDLVSVPVGDLFLAAVFPGLILAFLYALYVLAYGRWRPYHAPLPQRPAAKRQRGHMRALLSALLPAIGLILAVLGSIFFGVATPTEASGMGAFGALLLAVANRNCGWSTLQGALLDTYKTTAYIVAILIGASCFSLVLRQIGGDEVIAGLLQGLQFGPYGTVVFVLAIMFLLGFLMDWIEITLILLPLVAPVVSQLNLPIDGFNQLDKPALVWFLICVAVVLQTSFLTPPVGFALFYLKGVCPPEIQLGQIYRGVVPFVILQLICLCIVFAFPSVATWLPAIDSKWSR